MAGVLRDCIVERDQDPPREFGVPRVLNIGTQDRDRNLPVRRIEVARHGDQGLGILVEEPFYDEPGFQCLGISLQARDKEAFGPGGRIVPLERPGFLVRDMYCERWRK